MATLASDIEKLTLRFAEDIHVRSSITATFAALLEQVGPANQGHDGTPLPMTIEPWPGGRWFRDLGDGNGHFWGTVQAIKRPTLLEITGPMMLSSAVIANVQYRLTKVEGGTLLAFRQTILGLIPDEYRDAIGLGWTDMLERIRKQAEAA